MTIHDFHAKLQAEDKDDLFAALAELRASDDLSSAVRAMMWPDVW